MTTPEAVKIKEARRNILRNLDLVYPSGLRIQALYQTVCAVDQLYDFNLFCNDIVYLKEKGYLRYIDDAFGGMDRFDNKVVKLTPDGKEIAEGTDRDPALEI